MEVIAILILAFLVLGVPLIVVRFMPKQELRFLPGVVWKEPSRHARIFPLVDEFGYAIAPTDAASCVLEKTREDGVTERCEVSYYRLDRHRHQFLGSEGYLTKREGGEIMRFDFEIDCPKRWPKDLGFSIAATSAQAIDYLEQSHGETFRVVDSVKEGACHVLDREVFPDALPWQGELLLQLFLGERALRLARLEFYGDWMVTSALRRDEKKLYVTFHLATVGIEVWSLEEIYKAMFKTRDLIHDRIDRIKVEHVMERAYAIIETPFGTGEHPNERALAFMTLQTLSKSNPKRCKHNHDARLVAALDARPSEFTYPRLIASLSQAQCDGISLATLIELFKTHQSPVLIRALRSRMDLTQLLAHAEIPGEFLREELASSWKTATCKEIVRDATHTHARHALVVLSYCLSARKDDLEDVAMRETIEEMLSVCDAEQERALLAILSAEDHAPIKAYIDAHMLVLLEAGKWEDAALIQYVLIANDQLPPLQLEAWRQSVSEADTVSMREILLGLDMADQGVLSLWAAFGEHAHHYEALRYDGPFREQVVQRTIEVCEQQGDIEATEALAMARHAAVWLSYEEEVFGQTQRFNMLRDAVRALITRLESAPFDPDVMRSLASLTDRLPPSMTSMVSKALKRWEKRRASWSQGALTFVDGASAGALTLDQESRSASPEE